MKSNPLKTILDEVQKTNELILDSSTLIPLDEDNSLNSFWSAVFSLSNLKEIRIDNLGFRDNEIPIDIRKLEKLEYFSIRNWGGDGRLKNYPEEYSFFPISKG